MNTDWNWRGVSFAVVPFNQYQAEVMNDLEQLMDEHKLQNYLHEVHINQRENVPQQAHPRFRPLAVGATPGPQAVHIQDILDCF